MAQYKLVGVDFAGSRKYIVCDASQNPCSQDHRCCPLIAMANYIILSGRGKLDKSVAGNSVTEVELTNMIVRVMMARMEVVKITKPTDEDPNDLTLRFVRLLKSVTTDGIHVDPIFGSSDRFKYTDEWKLFVFSAIPLLHCYVVDPCLDTNNMFRVYPRDLLATKFVGREEVFDEFMARATEYGIASLPQHLDEGLAVFYRDGHYSVIQKYEGELFSLETNYNIVSSLPGATWKALKIEVNDMFYLTSQYLPTPKQQNLNQAIEWCEAKLAQKLRELGEPVANVSSNEHKKKKHKKCKPKQHIENGGKACDEAESSNETNPIPTVVARNGDEDDDGLLTISSNFYKFLCEFTDGSGTDPHFEGVVAGMKHLGLLTMHVPFAFIEMHDKGLAMAIQNLQSRELHLHLTHSVAQYLVSKGFDKAMVLQNAELKILNLPDPKSVQFFEDFAAENNFIQKFEVYDGETDTSTTHVARLASLGYLGDILDTHRKKKSWAGQWKKPDMVVRNGKEFKINKEPEFDLNKENGTADFQNFIDTTFEHFKDENGRYPAFFDEFKTDCKNMPDPLTEELKWRKFLKLMYAHLAFKAPLVRSTLICEVYRVADSMRFGSGNFAPLQNAASLGKFQNRDNLGDFRETLRKHAPFKKVYDFRNYDNAVTGLYNPDKWGLSYWFLLRYLRHFIEHVLDYTKKKDGINQQQIEDITIVDIMLSRHLSEYIAKLVRFLVYECDLEGSFCSTWGHFEASECFDRPQTNAPKRSEEEKSAMSAEKLVSNLFPKKPHQPDTARGDSEVVKGNKKLTSFCPPSTSSSHKTVLVGDLYLADFKDFLANKGFQVEFAGGALWCGEQISVRKIGDSIQQGCTDSEEIIIEGPSFDDNYRDILEIVGSWLIH